MVVKFFTDFPSSIQFTDVVTHEYPSNTIPCVKIQVI